MALSHIGRLPETNQELTHALKNHTFEMTRVISNSFLYIAQQLENAQLERAKNQQVIEELTQHITQIKQQTHSLYSKEQLKEVRKQKKLKMLVDTTITYKPYLLFRLKTYCCSNENCSYSLIYDWNSCQ